MLLADRSVFRQDCVHAFLSAQGQKVMADRTVFSIDLHRQKRYGFVKVRVKTLKIKYFHFNPDLFLLNTSLTRCLTLEQTIHNYVLRIKRIKT